MRRRSALDVLLDPHAELVPAAESSLGGVTVLNTVARRVTKPRARRDAAAAGSVLSSGRIAARAR